MCQGVQKVVLNALFKLLPNLPLQIEIPKVKSVLQNINHVKQKCIMIQTSLARTEKISYIILFIKRKNVKKAILTEKMLKYFTSHLFVESLIKCVAQGLGERVT